jgi:adenylate cyclase
MHKSVKKNLYAEEYSIMYENNKIISSKVKEDFRTSPK